MKKIILSTVAITTLALTGAHADTSSDIADMKAMMKQMSQRLAKLEAENTKLKANQKKQAKVVKKVQARQTLGKTMIPATSINKESTPVFAKASKLKFSGTHYIGFVSANNKNTATGESFRDNYFETRRNYLQVKAYLFDDPKSYARVTFDTHQVKDNGNTSNAGDWEVRLKYAYLYINDVLPFTGVEFGQAHRPWIDYEEHHGWLYRSISKTFVEKGQEADFTNSADLGINFKTKTEYFSSELGLFNGEGYHGALDKDADNGLSFEWRLTANLLGTGEKHVHKESTYADVSFYGQYNTDYSKKGDADTGDFIWYGLNVVYNQPEFLVAANYLKADEAAAKYKGDGYSVNGELRLKTFDSSLNAWNIIGRYDKFSLDAFDADKETFIAGLTYKWNKNVEFILNYEDDKDPANTAESEKIMFTSEVNW
jgi:Ni/Co efflux regulator RcnB